MALLIYFVEVQVDFFFFDRQKCWWVISVLKA